MWGWSMRYRGVRSNFIKNLIRRWEYEIYDFNTLCVLIFIYKTELLII